MKKYFVNYEQSLALKELGFDMPCFAYVYTGDTGNNVDRYEETEPSRAINFNHDSLCVSQPLKSQVFEWFREKHKIEATVACYYSKILGISYEERLYHCHIVRDGTTTKGPKFKTYEEAESACIDKLIEIIKEIK